MGWNLRFWWTRKNDNATLGMRHRCCVAHAASVTSNDSFMSSRWQAATHSQTVAWALSIFFYSCRADNLPSIGNLVSYAWCSRAADGLALRHLSYIAASSRFYMLKQLSTGSCQEILHRILFNVAHPPARIVRYIIGWNCVIALARRHRHIIIWTRERHIFFSVIL